MKPAVAPQERARRAVTFRQRDAIQRAERAVLKAAKVWRMSWSADALARSKLIYAVDRLSSVTRPKRKDRR